MITSPRHEPTASDRWMLKIMNDERYPVLNRAGATRTRRRLLVIAHIALTAAIALPLAFVFMTLPGQPPAQRPLWPFLIMLITLLALLLVWCLVTAILNHTTRGLLELHDRVLDERQLAERDRVHARANRALMTLLWAALVVTLVGIGLTGSSLSAPVPLVLVGVLLVHWLLPLWTAGLTAHDEPTEDTR